ncbi:fatty acid metabolism regulator protein [Spirochaetia bacterium]|nr:fatty acid metabolism regulator protein [Spirochaetia bacterium]
MSIVVEHDKRRQEILTHALDVFTEEGFENATFQKIADHCGITRTTLYIYFKNKTEIFNYSIKNMLLGVEEDLLRVKDDEALNSVEKIRKVLILILERLEKNRRLLSVSLNYLLYLSKSDTDTGYRVRRRTIRTRRILASMLIEGIRAGTIKPINVRATDDLLYGILETAIFRMVVLKQNDVGELKKSVEQALAQISTQPLTV